MVRDVEGLTGEVDGSRTRKAGHRQCTEAFHANGTTLNKELLFFIFLLLAGFTHGTRALEKLCL